MTTCIVAVCSSWGIFLKSGVTLYIDLLYKDFTIIVIDGKIGLAGLLGEPSAKFMQNHEDWYRKLHGVSRESVGGFLIVP